MSEEREDARGPAKRRGSLRELASSAVLIAAVATVLGAGRLLQTAPEPPAPTPPTPTTIPPLSLGSTLSPETAPAPAPSPAAVPPSQPAPRPRRDEPDEPLPPLAARAAADLTRLASQDGAWTAQLLLACKTDTVERLLGSEPEAAKLFVLPAEFRGESCFRVCFGSYASAKEAAAAADRPATLRGASVRAIAVAEVLR